MKFRLQTGQGASQRLVGIGCLTAMNELQRLQPVKPIVYGRCRCFALVFCLFKPRANRRSQVPINGLIHRFQSSYPFRSPSVQRLKGAAEQLETGRMIAEITITAGVLNQTVYDLSQGRPGTKGTRAEVRASMDRAGPAKRSTGASLQILFSR